MAILVGWSCLAGAEDVTPLQRRIQAGFLYNFAALTEWPTNTFASADTAIVIGVLGQDPFGTTLHEVLTNRHVTGRALAVRNFARGEEIDGCHILFVGASESGRLAALLKALEGKSILTVADFPGFADQGGMIEFVSAGQGEVGFQINNAAARRAKLRLSSRLLKLRITELVGPRADYPGRFAWPRSAIYQSDAS